MNKKSSEAKPKQLPGVGSSEIVMTRFSEAQKALAKKHGTPAEYAVACYRAVPEFISMADAADAISVYIEEWNRAS